ncbi:hypothetical protein CGLO_10465 [Colletotrichum gloeosporioides Cg-14]|uniref:Uncharacterized protein n=1 Tax=Colletotrichum gloeosporioides (strain Cg-14) TaxID=1237896 RepID=T0K3L2_COLGC|nr:hypothetical protein CGLO_10465 [Colletotrichum gloeosporioides Cg-14]
MKEEMKMKPLFTAKVKAEHGRAGHMERLVQTQSNYLQQAMQLVSEEH